MTSLVVPVDVLAYCVGTVDHHGPVQSFAGGTTDFSSQSSGSVPPAYLGSNVVVGAGETPLWSLETGIHLHWAMPDSLVRADDQGNFPALPNRWLVTRIVGAGTSARHWVVESDALSTAAPGGNSGPTVPVQTNAGQGGGTTADGDTRSFRYIGANAPLEQWTETLGTAMGRPLLSMTGAELNAVSTGSPGFCAYYPDARGVFGFWDDLGDVTQLPAELAYVVTGWYDLGDNDPLNAGLSLAALQKTLGWTYSGTAAEAPTRSLYSGLVQQIPWDPGNRYVDDNPKPVNADVAVGNTPGEALAAWLGGALHPGLTAFEELMTLYSAGLLHILADPGADQLALLEESLHALQFAGTDGGTIYTVTRGDAEATDLPLALADALNALNAAQQACDLASNVEVQAKWQLFADWFRAFASSSDNKTAALNAFGARFAMEPGILANAAAARAARDSSYASAQAMVPTGMSLTATPAARYSQGAEPVVLLAGEAAARSPRYGGDGRFDPSGYLACRQDSDILTGISIGSTALAASSYAALAPASAELPTQAASLVEEAALLNASVGSAASGVAGADLLADLDTWAQGGAPQYYREPAGLPPSPVALAYWDGANPRPSLMLLWEADFHPLLDTGVAGTDYAADFFTASFQLNPGAPRSVAYSPGGGGIVVDPATIDFDPDRPLSGTYRYTGTAALSGASAANLRARIEADPGIVTDPTLQAIADLLGKTDVALRNLSGFNDALLSRERVLQLSAGTPSTGVPMPFRTITSQLLSAVPSLKGIPPLSPRIDGAYDGIRTGFMRLSLEVMDPFGCKRPVTVGNTYIADTMAAMSGGQKVDGVVYLQPRISQPTRLFWRWLAADGTEDDEMNDHPATTPVCGWLLPSHLDTGFFFYDAAGNPIGALTLRDDGSGIDWQPAPGNQATVDESSRGGDGEPEPASRNRRQYARRVPHPALPCHVGSDRRGDHPDQPGGSQQRLEPRPARRSAARDRRGGPDAPARWSRRARPDDRRARKWRLRRHRSCARRNRLSGRDRRPCEARRRPRRLLQAAGRGLRDRHILYRGRDGRRSGRRCAVNRQCHLDAAGRGAGFAGGSAHAHAAADAGRSARSRPCHYRDPADRGAGHPARAI